MQVVVKLQENLNCGVLRTTSWVFSRAWGIDFAPESVGMAVDRPGQLVMFQARMLPIASLSKLTRMRHFLKKSIFCALFFFYQGGDVRLPWKVHFDVDSLRIHLSLTDVDRVCVFASFFSEINNQLLGLCWRWAVDWSLCTSLHDSWFLPDMSSHHSL